MKNRYIRNYLYLNKDNQKTIKSYPILIAGCGIGSNIAECALRLGFETLSIIDGDTIELSNLNRQNYTLKDLNKSKSETLKGRLHAINPLAEISAYHGYLDKENIPGFLSGIKVAINALDYDTNAPGYFDQFCQELGIPVLHPYNLGWAALLTVIKPDGMLLESLSLTSVINEQVVVEYVLGKLKEEGKDIFWLLELATEYKRKHMKVKKSPPQLSVGSWLVAAICTDVLFQIATGQNVKFFPEFYFSSIK